jgi:hypothetical protein
MAMGTPVIASEVGGLAYLVENNHTGFHVPSRDAAALAARIHELLHDDAKRQQFSDCAHHVAQKYAWANVVDKMLAIYQPLLRANHETHALPDMVWSTECRIDTHRPAYWTSHPGRPWASAATYPLTSA